jgi:hypothetical protein
MILSVSIKDNNFKSNSEVLKDPSQTSPSMGLQKLNSSRQSPCSKVISGISAEFSRIQDAFCGLFKKNEDNYLKEILILKTKIQQLRQGNVPGWQEQAMRLIRHSYSDNFEQELQRLRALNVLTKAREKKLDQSLNNINPLLFHFIDLCPSWMIPAEIKAQKLQAKILFGRAFEIKDLYKNTHHVFIHAQATKWVTLTYLLKELVRKFHPEIDIRNFKFLRSPGDPFPADFLNQLWSHVSSLFGLNKPYKDVQSYLSSKWLPVNDSLDKTRKELMSVDAFYYNHFPYESSMFFLVKDSNIVDNLKVIEKFSKECIQYFASSISNAKLNLLSQRVVSAFSPKSDPCGNLFVLCLPKEDSHKIQYRAHPFGPPCKCHPRKNDNQILENLQNEVFDITTECKSKVKVPQYRVYTPLLKPGQGKRIYLLTPFEKPRRKAIKAKIKKIVEEVYKEISK